MGSCSLGICFALFEGLLWGLNLILCRGWDSLLGYTLGLKSQTR